MQKNNIDGDVILKVVKKYWGASVTSRNESRFFDKPVEKPGILAVLADIFANKPCYKPGGEAYFIAPSYYKDGKLVNEETELFGIQSLYNTDRMKEWFKNKVLGIKNGYDILADHSD